MEFGKDFKKIKQGAEARMYLGTYLGKSTIVKERFEKKYRHPTLDANITKDRIRAEVRAIIKCKIAGIPTPAVYLVDMNRRCIFMEYIKGLTVKDYIENLETEYKKCEDKEDLSLESTVRQLGIKIGQLVGRMHSSSIVHGDLTSSNILISSKDKSCENESKVHHEDEKVPQAKFANLVLDMENVKLVLIDFGLGKTESSAEDKGVDLYVLERALLSTHPNVAPKILFPSIIKGYTNTCAKGAPEVIAKLEEVRMRGRKRTMVG